MLCLSKEFSGRNLCYKPVKSQCGCGNSAETRRALDFQIGLIRGHGRVAVFLWQLLSDHVPLHKMGRVESPTCRNCLEERDDSYHNYFACDLLAVTRRMQAHTIGDFITQTIMDAVGEKLERS